MSDSELPEDDTSRFSKPSAPRKSKDRVDPAEMAEARVLINQIVNALRRKAFDGKISLTKVEAAYDAVNESDRPEGGIKPKTKETYFRLFSFGKNNGRHYLEPNGFNLQLSHIVRIVNATDALGYKIIETKPTAEPATWLPPLRKIFVTIGGTMVTKLPGVSVTPDANDAAATTAMPFASAGSVADRSSAQAMEDSQAVDKKPASGTTDELSEPLGHEIVEVSGAEGHPEALTATFISQRAVANTAAPLRTRTIIGVGVFLVICLGGVSLHRVADRAPRKASTLRSSTATSNAQLASVGGNLLASVIDAKLLVGSKATPERSNVGSVQIYKVDPRLNQAAKLRMAGNQAEGDRLTQVVIDEWSTTRAVSTEIEAEAHRQLGASAYAQCDFDGAIVEYQKVVGIESIDARASDFNELGAAFYAKRDLISAIANYSRAIHKDRYYAGAYLNRGNAYLDQVPPNVDLAIGDYDVAIQINPNSSDAYTNRANAFAQKNDYEHAFADLKTAMRVGPDNARPYNGLGAMLYERNDLSGAIKNYSEAIRKDPNLETAWVNRGFARLLMNDAEHAVGDFTTAIGIISKNRRFDKELAANARWGLASSYNAIFKYNEALAVFDELVAVSPGDAFARAGRGLAYGGMAQYDKALQCFAEAINIDPRQFEFYLMRGSLNLNMADIKAAVHDFDEAIRLAPDAAEAYLERGIARAYLNDAGATSDFEKAEQLGKATATVSLAKASRYMIALDVDHALDALLPLLTKPEEQDPATVVTAYWMRAGIYAFRNRFDDAIADIDKIISALPTTMVFYLGRAQLFEKESNIEKAALDFDRAIECDPKGPFAYFARAEFYERQRNYDRSTHDFNSAISLQGSYYTRAKSFEETGDYKLAIQEYSALLRESPKMFDGIYLARGRAYRGYGDFENAISDYSTLTTLEPNEASAWVHRGDTFYASGDYPRAIEDYTTATGKNGTAAYVYFDRGKAHEAQHEYELTMADYRRAIAEKYKAPDPALRLYILRAVTDQDAASKELEENATALGPLERLHSVLELFRGRSSVEEAVSSAGDLKCETQYYVGSWYLLKHDEPQAKKAFGQALAMCSRADIPYYDAKIAAGNLH